MAAIIPIVQGIASAAQQIKQLNETGQEQIDQDEEVVGGQDPQTDSTLVSQKDSFRGGANLKIQVGSMNIGIGFEVYFTKEQGKEKEISFGVQAKDSTSGQSMEGVIGETPDKDRKGTFTDESWEQVQGKREDCVKIANPNLQPATPGPTLEKDQNKS